ncbi:MAG: phosphoribosyltransferase family protein [Spongiibacteraceae bacterium]
MLRIRGPFSNREEAGAELAARLRERAWRNPIVFALPRGGVPVAFEIASALRAPLDVVLVRKIGAPMQKELAIGAITDGNPPHIFIDPQLVSALGVRQSYIQQETARQLDEIKRRRDLYGVAASPALLQGKSAIVVDDGIATGATMRVALHALKARKPDALILAIPVAPRESLEELKRAVDSIVCLQSPEYFPGVGAFYSDFAQVDDSEVVDLLRRSRDWLESSRGMRT